MTSLATLKLTAAQKPTHIPQVQLRRHKLLRRLDEQAELAKALATGSTYAATKLKTITDANGVRQQVEARKRVKAWWFVSDNGKLNLSVRYGSKVLDLARGKNAVEVASEKDLVATLDVIKAAVQAGELDAQIELASTKLKAGFVK